MGPLIGVHRTVGSPAATPTQGQILTLMYVWSGRASQENFVDLSA